MSAAPQGNSEHDRELDHILRLIRRFVDKYYPRSSDPVLTWHQDGQREPNHIEITDKFSSYPRQFRHSGGLVASSDFKVVTWRGTTWRLSNYQAGIIRFLCEARENEGGEGVFIDQRFILEYLGCETTRLNQLFKEGDGHLIYKALVEHDGNGGYRLRPEPKE